MADKQLRIMIMGAHPDDGEVKVGGTAALWARAGHEVCFVSATNGETGHHEQGGATLTRRRIAEAAASAEVLGIRSVVLPIPNGQITPILPYRRMFIKTIREFRPDLVITHRPNDYHPDHRYTSQLVQDSAYVVTVPNNTPETPPLRYNPVMAYMSDRFAKPYPFAPTVVIDITSTVQTKYDALHCHTSQMYEWIPWNQGRLDEVPDTDADRRQWMFNDRAARDDAIADRYRDLLIARYGQERGSAVQYAEAFEACEYGAKMDEAQIERLVAGV